MSMSHRYLRCVATFACTLIVAGCSGSRTSSDRAESSQGKGQAATTTRRPTDPELIARNNRGVGQMGKFEYAAACDTFAALVAEQPRWLDAKVNLAIATLNRQQEADEETALQLLEQVLKADDTHLRAHYCTGLLKMRRGAVESARQHFRKVVDGDPPDAYAAYFLAQTLEAKDEAAALQYYQQAVEIDPYLRSAYYRLFQVLQRSGQTEEARKHLEVFQRLENNPRAHLVEIKYTRMGRKAEARTVDLSKPKAGGNVRPPAGDLFAAPTALLHDAERYTWNDNFGNRHRSITACDFNGDGLTDLFIADALRERSAVNAVIVGQGEGGFALELKHPLARVPNVNAALWGDYDNDGLVDVYFCRRGPNALWRQTSPGEWSDVTESSRVAAGDLDTTDGAFVDADHDGDLDIFCVQADGSNELLNNNLDGTFRPIAAEQGLSGNGLGSRQVVPLDIDGDRDMDLLVINESPPSELYLNDRLWQYHSVTTPLAALPIAAAIAADLGGDGVHEIYAATADGKIHCLTPTRHGRGDLRWDVRQLGLTVGAGKQLAAVDTTGDGRLEILLSTEDGWAVCRVGQAEPLATSGEGRVVSWAPIVLDAQSGPAMVGIAPQGQPLIWRPGPGRHPFAAFTFSGQSNKADAMRSNASGIGIRVALRRGSQWTIAQTPGSHSGPGQSLQPMAIGLGNSRQVDFVAIDWSDGVFQTEIDLAAGKLHHIVETQRQLSSCPVLLAWNGQEFAFVSDLLGVGGLGYLLAPGQYSEPRPWENFLLPHGTLVPHQDCYQLKVHEPMEEVCYLDAARLVQYDLPPGWRMTLDERMGITAPLPSGEPRFYRTDAEIPLSAAHNERGEDVLEHLAAIDHVAAPLGELDRRFIGRLAGEHRLTLTFGQAIDRGHGKPVLIIDGWIEYPYSQTMFAAWQAQADYQAPTLEARSAQGDWHVVHRQFGYPAGMPRQMSVPLEDLPEATRQLRLSTNQEIYFDHISVVYCQPCQDVRREELRLVEARVAQTGFARRTTGAQRLPHYDYSERDPLWDTKHQAGLYTALGQMTELVGHTDDAVAIIGPGEEVHLEFAVSGAEVSPGWTRHFVLEASGWCKDRDLLTRDGETIDPLPSRGGADPSREDLHRKYNTRYRSGY